MLIDLGPIDGSEEYLKYTWYYQRYQPKYEISHNRTIVFTNITDQMQGFVLEEKGSMKLIVKSSI